MALLPSCVLSFTSSGFVYDALHAPEERNQEASRLPRLLVLRGAYSRDLFHLLAPPYLATLPSHPSQVVKGVNPEWHETFVFGQKVPQEINRNTE